MLVLENPTKPSDRLPSCLDFSMRNVWYTSTLRVANDIFTRAGPVWVNLSLICYSPTLESISRQISSDYSSRSLALGHLVSLKHAFTHSRCVSRQSIPAVKPQQSASTVRQLKPCTFNYMHTSRAMIRKLGRHFNYRPGCNYFGRS